MVKALTVYDVAEKLQVSRWLVYKMVERGELKGVKRVGGLLRFPPDIIDKLFSVGERIEQL